jgi:hypothetical protein
MQLEAALRTAAPAARVLTYVADLADYPQWMSLVHLATPVPAATVPTWDVELRAKVGPFARSKRLRMVRTTYDTTNPTRVVFERRELDGREHAAWRLEVTINTTALGATELVMQLHYDGRLFVSVVEAILQQNIDAGRSKLAALLEG